MLRKIVSIAFAAILFTGANVKAAALNDGQSAQFVIVASQGEVTVAELAVKTSTNADVKKFAEELVKDHTAMVQEFQALAAQEKLTLQDSEELKKAVDKGKQVLAKLQTLKGNDFDKAFLDEQIDCHDDAIEMLENNMIPNAKNAAVKAALQKGLTSMEAHLNRAIAIRVGLPFED